MEGIKWQLTESSEVETIYKSIEGKIVKRNDFKVVSELEEVLALVAHRTGYQRSELLAMYVHEFYALVNFLKKD